MAPAAIRHKNPGAMWPGKIATKWGSKRWVYLNDGTGQGGNGKGNKIATFDNWIDGICAQLDLWRTSANYKNKTLAAALRIWSGGNHVESYISYVTARVPGITRNTIMDDTFWRSPNGARFLKVQAGHEAGKTMPVPDDLWLEAQKRVFAGKMPAAGPKTKSTVAVGTGTGAVVTAVQGGFPLWAALLIGAGVAVVVFVIWKMKQAPASATAVIPEHLPAIVEAAP